MARRRPANIPDEYRDQVGSVTADRTIPQLQAFIENGGTVVAIGGSATNLARHLGLAFENHLVENGQPLTQQKYYVPGRCFARTWTRSIHWPRA